MQKRFWILNLTSELLDILYTFTKSMFWYPSWDPWSYYICKLCCCIWPLQHFPVALLIWFLQNIHQRNLWLKPKIMATSGMHYMHLPTWSQHTALSLVAHRLMLDSHWSISRKELAMCGLDNPLIIQNTLTQAVNGDHWLPHKVPNMLLIHERQFQMWKAKIIGQLHPPCPSRALELAQPKSLIGFF